MPGKNLTKVKTTTMEMFRIHPTLRPKSNSRPSPVLITPLGHRVTGFTFSLVVYLSLPLSVFSSRSVRLHDYFDDFIYCTPYIVSLPSSTGYGDSIVLRLEYYFNWRNEVRWNLIKEFREHIGEICPTWLALNMLILFWNYICGIQCGKIVFPGLDVR